MHLPNTICQVLFGLLNCFILFNIVESLHEVLPRGKGTSADIPLSNHVLLFSLSQVLLLMHQMLWYIQLSPHSLPVIYLFKDCYDIFHSKWGVWGDASNRWGECKSPTLGTVYISSSLYYESSLINNYTPGGSAGWVSSTMYHGVPYFPLVHTSVASDCITSSYLQLTH